MSNASHRKPREHSIHIPAIPWGYLVTGAVLFMLCVALLVAVSLLGKPTYAGASTTGYLKPAVTAAGNIKLKPSIQAYTQFLVESGSYGLGVNPGALPWY